MNTTNLAIFKSKSNLLGHDLSVTCGCGVTVVVGRVMGRADVLYPWRSMLPPSDRRYAQLSQRLSKIMRENIPDWQCIKGSRHTRGLHGARVTAWRRPSNAECCHPGDTGVTAGDTLGDTYRVVC